MAVKKAIASKNIWFNVLSIAAMSLTALLADDAFRELVGTNATYLIISVNVINMVIRFYTVKPLEVAGATAPAAKPIIEADKVAKDNLKLLEEAEDKGVI